MGALWWRGRAFFENVVLGVEGATEMAEEAGV